MTSPQHSPTELGGRLRGALRRPRLVALVAAGAAAALALTAALAVVVLRSDRFAALRSEPVAGPTSAPEVDPKQCGTAGDLRYDTELTGVDGGAVPYSVSLPADYYTACREYPVLFALHGRDQSNATFLDDAEAVRAAVDDGALRDVVIVTPDSARDGRWEGRYDTAFIDELLPHVEQTFRVLPGAEHRLLVGFSMGGHGAFRFGITHPDLFAAVWAVDGAMSRQPTDYLASLDLVRAEEPRIRSVGGNLNGDRVEQVVDLFAAEGVTLPYERLPLEHDFTLFVDADRAAGWPTARWMDEQLGAGTDRTAVGLASTS